MYTMLLFRIIVWCLHPLLIENDDSRTQTQATKVTTTPLELQALENIKLSL